MLRSVASNASQTGQYRTKNCFDGLVKILNLGLRIDDTGRHQHRACTNLTAIERRIETAASPRSEPGYTVPHDRYVIKICLSCEKPKQLGA